MTIKLSLTSCNWQVLCDNSSQSANFTDRAEVVRPNSNWKSERNGKLGGTKKEKH